MNLWEVSEALTGVGRKLEDVEEFQLSERDELADAMATTLLDDLVASPLSSLADPSEELDALAQLEAIVAETPSGATEEAESELDALAQLEAFAETPSSPETEPAAHNSPHISPDTSPLAFDSSELFSILEGPELFELMPSEPPTPQPASSMLYPLALSQTETQSQPRGNVSACGVAPTTLISSQPAAGTLEGRTCAERWQRRDWTPVEDDVIRSLVARFGCKWRRIAQQLPGRSDDSVRNRWGRIKVADEAPDGMVPPSVSHRSRRGEGSSGDGEYVTRPERLSWTQEEDELIVSTVAALGHKWSRVSKYVEGRTGHAIRNRYHRLQAMAKDQADIAGISPTTDFVDSSDGALDTLPGEYLDLSDMMPTPVWTEAGNVAMPMAAY